ncbi:MAG: dihydropteroate synthase [Candidatus Latescibacteria bacterium]|jgi:5-methyltetrahydrofolate corrinoid/iron sulfur protein methyltransferase|nr:dihydropteroate synthase [Candidatus Latescibacterota bacterium]
MIMIGESINVMSKTLRPAMRNRDPKPIQKMAIAQQEAGVDYHDLNIGPARKGGPEMMQWLVETIQEVSDVPLFLDTTNVEAMEAGLKAHKGTAVINSISCRPERMEALLPLVTRYDASFVGLLIGVDGIPRDDDERAMLAAEMQAAMMERGISEDRVFFDPIVLPVSSQQDQLQTCTAFMMMLQDLVPGSKATCGLSNVSNGAPTELRPILDQTYLAMLLKYGLDSAIVNAFEKELMDIGKGRRDDIVQVVHRVMDGEDVDMPSLSEELTNYVKTTRVLLAQSLYSHSWLQV